MRLDDEYAWQGDIRAGSLYDDSEATQIVQDFLLFCRLAKDRSAIPANWSWSQCLQVASEHLVYAFDKSCAREKYGRENIFSPMIGSGRSLRYDDTRYIICIIFLHAVSSVALFEHPECSVFIVWHYVTLFLQVHR